MLIDLSNKYSRYSNWKPKNTNSFYDDKGIAFNEYPCVSGLGLIKPIRKYLSDRVDLPYDLYYIRMSKYGTNRVWALNMIDATYNIAHQIEDNKGIDTIIKNIGKSLRIFNDSSFGERRNKTCGCCLFENGRGSEYYHKYCSKLKTNKLFFSPESNNEYKEANVCKIDGSLYPGAMFVQYGWNGEQSNLDLVKKEYNKLKQIKNPTLKQINRSCAIIQWLIAQECPFVRGSDSFANLLTRSIYLAYGYKPYPLKENTSLDFEAFYRNLDDYIENYPSFFEKEPEKVSQLPKLDTKA